MRPECLQALSDALDKRRRDDTLEKALGREFRRVGLIYQDYLDLMETVRARSRKDKIDYWAAAKKLLEEQK